MSGARERGRFSCCSLGAISEQITLLQKNKFSKSHFCLIKFGKDFISNTDQAFVHADVEN